MSRTVLVSDRLSLPVAEYSHAVRSGPFALMGAKGATRRNGPVPLGENFEHAIETQSELTLANVEHVLKTLDTRPDEVAQVTAYLTDWRFQTAVDEGLARLLTKGPAVGHVFSSAFALPELLFEIDLVAVPEATSERLIADDTTRATWSAGWLFSAGLSAGPGAVGCTEELSDLSTQIDAILAESGLSRENVLRLRWSLTDARDLATLDGWLEGWGGSRPAIIALVGSAAGAGRRLSVDFVASSERPERVDEREAAWTAHGSHATAATFAGGVAFTSASAVTGTTGLGVEGIVERLGAAVAPFGLEVADVAKVEGVLDDWRLYSAFRREYAQTMSRPYPTRSLTQGGPSHAGAHVQLSWIAISGAAEEATLLASPGTGTDGR